MVLSEASGVAESSTPMDTTITVSGTVGTDVDLTTGDDWAFGKFRLACTPRFRRGTEWVDGETTWLSVQTRGVTAHNVAASIHKGDPVFVLGRLRPNNWVDQSGAKHSELVVEASSVGHDLSRGRAVFSRPPKPSTTSAPSSNPPSYAAGVVIEQVDESALVPAASGGN